MDVSVLPLVEKAPMPEREGRAAPALLRMERRSWALLMIEYWCFTIDGIIDGGFDLATLTSDRWYDIPMQWLWRR